MSEISYANDIADWCEREVTTARRTGNLDTRPFVQNATMIIAALRCYAKQSSAAPESEKERAA